MKGIGCFLSLLLLCGTGCRSGHYYPDAVNLSQNIRYGDAFWRLEIERTTHTRDFVIVSVHGNTAFNTWFAYPDNSPPIPMEQFLRTLKLTAFPDRLVWLISCNPGHHETTVDGVAYAKETVWTMPDRFCPNPGGPEVGRASEFVINTGSRRAPTTKPSR